MQPSDITVVLTKMGMNTTSQGGYGALSSPLTCACKTVAFVKVSIYRPTASCIRDNYLWLYVVLIMHGDQNVLRAGRYCHTDTVSMDTPHLQSIVEL